MTPAPTPSVYAVIYDLLHPHTDYRRFVQTLRSFQPAIKVTASTYLITTDRPAGEVLETLLRWVHRDDRVVVVGPLAVWACYNTGEEVIRWMREHIAP
jgi:hypothetical protein